jgi:iron transport multicopper oxidase
MHPHGHSRLSQATLINGLGRSFANPGNNSLAVITIKQHKRWAISNALYPQRWDGGVSYRLRIVSMSCDPNYMFSIDQHNMTVIEADGVNTQMLTVDKIQVFAGQHPLEGRGLCRSQERCSAQRYSVILNANQNIDNYCECVWLAINFV